MSRKRKKPDRVSSVTEAEKERRRALLEAVCEQQFDSNQSKLGRAIGVSQTHISDILGRKKDVGEDVLRKLEQVATSATLSAVIGRGLIEPFPSRTAVVELARGEGAPEHLLRALRAVEPPCQDDPGTEYWQAKLVELDELRERISAGLGKGRKR